MHDLAQAPLAIAGQSALSAASLATQAFANVETLGGFAPLSLYCLTIARSGERKTYCDKLLLSGLREHERERAAEYKTEVAESQMSQRLWVAKRDKLVKEATAGKKGALEAQADLRALGPEPEPPLSPNLTASEPTLEGLHKLYVTGEPSLGIFSDEGGQFLGGHAMNQDNRLKTIAGLSALWDGAAINRTRAGDGAATLLGRRLAAHIMVQPVAAQPLLSDALATEQGFLARFLITEPPSAIGTRTRRDTNAGSRASLDRFEGRLRHVLRAPKPIRDGSRQELDPRLLRLSPDARTLLWGYYDAIERQQAPGGDLTEITGFASKSAEQAARISGVLTVWTDIEASQVGVEAMQYGIALAQYHLAEAKRLTEAAAVSDRIKKAETLRKWLLEKWPKRAAAEGRTPDFIIPRDVAQYGPYALRETDKAKAALKMLADHQWLYPLEQGTEIDGKPRQVAYRINGGSHAV
ncbi:YfjI family protein [Ovoidimarina sediminis]|uniref:YfjI family protein n=1 Tax=Ovoidimarina sediminis TaxID=3079856 RepID=UPI0029069329|nr:YfjI family protein [Rhodophyticola sp. MJ-SS7]MDU8946466.1 YfjI family protein [Rhodophyticola sp. MJ-SS7]